MRRFGQMRDRIKDILAAVTEGVDPDPITHPFEGVIVMPGPNLPDIPDRYVLLTPYGGPGLNTGEGILDARGWQVRCVGLQHDEDSGEALADAIDTALLKQHSAKYQGVWVTGVQRVGGAPVPLMVDDADRTHWVCSYIVETESALV